jgi:RimJ/RimL family protein N-acetyltransferase
MRSPEGDTEPSQARAFVARHGPALERDEVRHNVLLMILGLIAAGDHPGVRCWSLGEGGACAVQTPPYAIVLGDLSQAQCHVLADQTRELDYPGVVGPDRTAPWFVDRARMLGIEFGEPVPEQIHVLREPPCYPGAPGHARSVGTDDAALLYDWTMEFMREAVPHDPAPDREQIAKAAAAGNAMLWIVDGEPVSMAAIRRRLRDAAAISAVYTPPELRGRGYAGSVTAAVVEKIFAEGRATACLYTDLRNPYSNRCYARIGFKPVCEAWHYPRA